MMRIPAWRVVLTGGALVILAMAGIGLAAAGAKPAEAPADNVASADVDTAAIEDAVTQAFEEHPGRRGRWALKAGRHLVHAEVTLVGREGELIEIWLDHGTVQSIGGGSLAIAEAGGSTRTVTVDDATIVYIGREDGDLGDVIEGAELFVQSRVTEGGPLAKRILVVPAGLDGRPEN